MSPGVQRGVQRGVNWSGTPRRFNFQVIYRWPFRLWLLFTEKLSRGGWTCCLGAKAAFLARLWLFTFLPLGQRVLLGHLRLLGHQACQLCFLLLRDLVLGNFPRGTAGGKRGLSRSP